MGEIKDGTVSSFLPSSEAFAVHYPGYPSSISRAVQTLGGAEAILKAHTSRSDKLELHFRPEDPYSHPAFGELRPCNSLLLKISKKNTSRYDHNSEASQGMLKGALLEATNTENGTFKSQPERESFDNTREIEACRTEKSQVSLCANIVARIPDAYHFEGMVDYQHVVAVHASVARRKKRTWSEMEEQGLGKGNQMDMDQDDVMLLVPPLFSLKDVPENVVLKAPSILGTKKKQEDVTQNELEVDVEPVLAIKFDIKEIPKKVNWEEYIPQGSEQWESQMVVSKLFEERPIWPKDSVIECLLDKGLNFRHDMIRRLLSRVAYYFSGGPFLRFWIRKGYDPRDKPESRIYQRLDFRVPPSLRNYCDISAANEMKHRRKEICAFRVFPSKYQTSLQLFELEDEYVQEEIKNPSSMTTCSCATGWFSQLELDCLRQRIKVRFLSILGSSTEIARRAAYNTFEKLKKRKRNSLKHDEEEQHQDNAEVMGDEDNEEPDYIEDIEEPDNLEDDEEDDIEVEDDELAFDMQESLDLSGLSMENASKSYLQEVILSRPSIKEGGDNYIEDPGSSADEYEIYEQDSDEDNSDDYD